MILWHHLGRERGNIRTIWVSRALAIVLSIGFLMPGVGARPSEAADDVVIEVLSNRPDLVSGGDALVSVVVPNRARASAVRVDVNGRDVTRAFVQRTTRRLVGIVGRLRNGANVLRAQLPDGSGARIAIRNHPIGGPVFAGPQIRPWTCAPGAKDRQCNRATVHEFSYMPENGSGLQPYDPENPPSDVATTTTDNGATVPYIVRQEIGVIDRDEFRVAVLYDPSKPWKPWAPQPGFNHKLVITHGASCDTAYEQGAAPDVMNTTALSRGFVVMSHALDNAGHNCNLVTEGESLIMTKEHVIETYGPLRHTIGSGCSGGSLTQQHLANAYPGLYQGITPACSFPDGWSSGMQYEDYHLLRDYFEHPEKWDPGVLWTPRHQGLVNGHPNPSNPATFTTAIPDKGPPNRSCPGVDSAKLYDPETNRKGVRCTFQDYMVNVFGRRKTDGFAGRPWDNVGVQYGLRPLMTGGITPAHFVDVNEKIGGRDIDHNAIPTRAIADPFALRALYRSGAINSANNLANVAIIDLRGPDPGAFHDVYRTYSLRSRLLREHGTADNQVLWRGMVALFGDAGYADEAILAMDRWLLAVEGDTSKLSLATKVVKHRPAERCTNGTGVEVPAAVCDAVVESYTAPRIEAGMPFSDDNMKCRLRPLRASEYYPIQFSAEQWERLRKTFPSGVCDYSRRGIGQQPTVPWQTYQDASGRVIYGGRPMGAAPKSVPFGAR